MNVAITDLSAVSLCAGVGMLDEGVRAAFDHLGIAFRTVAYGEWEAPAASQLVALMEAGLLEPAPVWCGDFRRIDAGAFRGTVDAVVAGFPCQDLSIAGRRAGLNGKRSGLFFSVVDFADACGAWLLVLENVGGIASATASVVDEEEGELEERAAARVLGELADRGWHAEWITLPASDVGANHGRERWFCVAWRQLADAARDGRDGSPGQAGRGRGVRQAGDAVAHPERAEWRPVRLGGTGALEGHDGGRPEEDRRPGVPDEALGNTQDDHWWRGIGAAEEGAGPGRIGRRGSAASGGALAIAPGDGWHEGWPEPGREQGRPDAAFCGLPIFAPGPADDRWSGILAERPELAPATEPGVRVLVDGVALLVDESRNHQLRQVGNGVVPLQAAAAVVVLARRAGLVTDEPNG